MAADEYSTGGGKLKLKGSKVSGGRIEKKKKKTGKKKDESGPSVRPDEEIEKEKDQDQAQPREGAESADKPPLNESEESEATAAKTETERKYEEVRRKRLHERLQREGVKTHKERVEELNTYLSRLSEHHDMPKIGPG